MVTQNQAAKAENEAFMQPEKMVINMPLATLSFEDILGQAEPKNNVSKTKNRGVEKHKALWYNILCALFFSCQIAQIFQILQAVPNPKEVTKDAKRMNIHPNMENDGAYKCCTIFERSNNGGKLL